MLTLEEQERRAYISGNVREAELLARCIDGDADLVSDVEQAEDQAKQAERDADNLRDDLERAEDQVADLKREVERLEAEPRRTCA